MNIPSPLSVDPFIDLNYNLEFLNDIQFDEFENNFSNQFTDLNSKSDSTLSSNSIIDIDFLQDADINLDLLLNQDLDIQDDLWQNFPDNDVESDHFIINSDNNSKLFKKSRKSKNSILPFSIRDLDENYRSPMISNLQNKDLIHGKPGDRIYLSKEECEMLIRDGHSVPTHLPLTKTEERAVKSVRRKIRNKISAKNSRAKKETYVDGLEQRILLCSKENLMLRQKLADTEKDKLNLKQQIVNLKQLLSKFIPNTTTQSTSIMLLLLTFMVIFSPIFDPRLILKRHGIYNEDKNVKQIFPGRTRMLLQDSDTSNKVNQNYLVTVRSSPPWKIYPKSPAVSRSIHRNIKSRNISVQLFNETRPISLVKDL